MISAHRRQQEVREQRTREIKAWQIKLALVGAFTTWAATVGTFVYLIINNGHS